MTSPRQAFLAMALLLTAVLTVIFGAAVPLVSGYRHNLDRIAELESRVERLRAVAASRDNIKADIAKIKRQMRANETAFFPSKPPSVASAELQRKIKSLSESRGATLISSQPLNVDESERYPKLTTKINFNGSLSALQQILFELERSRPKLFIDEILILRRATGSTIRQRRYRSRNSGPSTTDQDMLDVRVSVSGYMRHGGDDEDDES